jgi:putative DNA methylase
MTYPKRLIEVDLPIKRISAHARREKSIRHGHISTLHIWWARRPLAACRAVICAALWPDPADALCPPAFQAKAAEVLLEFAGQAVGERALAESCDPGTFKRWQTLVKSPIRLDTADEESLVALRGLLLDFIADFANWDNSTRPAYLEASRAITEAAHEELGGVHGTRPLVVDPFAGGGAIPLEALRVGADAFASDLNPVAVLLNKVVLEYIPKYGQRLADEVRKWGQWIKEQAEQELAESYPKDPDGATPIAYLWARTITCEGPGCGAEVPLVRNLQLTHNGRTWFLSITGTGQEVAVSLNEGITSEQGTVRGGSATCPCCGFTTAAKSVRAQLCKKRGGSKEARMLAVYVEREGRRYFRQVCDYDHTAAQSASLRLDPTLLPNDLINPIRPYKNTRGLSAVTRIGITQFGDLYTPRQALAILTLQRLALTIGSASPDPELARAVITLCHFVASRYIFQNCALSRWHAYGNKIEGAFGKQALQVVWDFAEANPLSDGSANWNNALDWVVKVIETNSILPAHGSAVRAAAQVQVLPDMAASLLVTDPPYFAAIPYSDLSNVFYVWERELIRVQYPDLYYDGLVDQRQEIIVTNANRGINNEEKSSSFFRREMGVALSAARKAVIPAGLGVVVFADSSTESWEAIIGAVIDGGWTIVGSWPIDTEMQNRTQAAGAASLQSSVHIVCRPRENADGSLLTDMVGDWRDVLAELPRRIHDWMPRLALEGVVGADAIFACLGPALEIFSRYSRVEKASGEVVPLREYLEHVWAAVAREGMDMIFQGADATGFEEDARLTAMWLWTLKTEDNGSGNGLAPDEVEDEGDDEEGSSKPKATGGFALEFDAARLIAQGLGAHLEQLGYLVEVKGDTARLLPVSERTRYLFGKDEAAAPTAQRKTKKAQMTLGFTEELEEAEGTWGEKSVPKAGNTVLDRVHQAMILFAAGRSEAMKRFLVDEGHGQDPRLWRLAQALSALYPTSSDEKRWVDGVLARKKGLGL